MSTLTKPICTEMRKKAGWFYSRVSEHENRANECRATADAYHRLAEMIADDEIPEDRAGLVLELLRERIMPIGGATDLEMLRKIFDR